MDDENGDVIGPSSIQRLSDAELANKLQGVPWRPTYSSDDLDVPVVIAAEPEVDDDVPEA